MRRLVVSSIIAVPAIAVLWWAVRPPAAPGPPAGGRPSESFSIAPVGQQAPDFELPEFGTGRRARLSDFRGRPTVLMFGSFSCDLFCSQLSELVQMHREYGMQANFVFVYIREAGHGNAKLDAHIRDNPGGDRIAAGLQLYSIGFKCLDGRDSEGIRVYHGWPERLYLLDSNGVAVWDSTLGIGSEGLRLDQAEHQLRDMIRQ